MKYPQITNNFLQNIDGKSEKKNLLIKREMVENLSISIGHLLQANALSPCSNLPQTILENKGERKKEKERRTRRITSCTSSSRMEILCLVERFNLKPKGNCIIGPWNFENN